MIDIYVRDDFTHSQLAQISVIASEVFNTNISIKFDAERGTIKGYTLIEVHFPDSETEVALKLKHEDCSDILSQAINRTIA
jgi:hypothetical protein